MMSPLTIDMIVRERITEFHRQAEQRRRLARAHPHNTAIQAGIESLVDTGGHGAGHVCHANGSSGILD